MSESACATASGPTPSQMSQGSLRFVLREATADVHARLDRCFEGMTAADDARLYERFVRMNYGCHSAIEPYLLETELMSATPRGAMTQALTADMDALGLAPLKIEAPRIEQSADRVGMAYVLDGSRLGARYILRELETRQPAWYTAETTNYLRAAAAPDRFRDRMAMMEAVLTQDDWPAAVAAARAGFALFESAVEAMDREVAGA